MCFLFCFTLTFTPYLVIQGLLPQHTNEAIWVHAAQNGRHPRWNNQRIQIGSESDNRWIHLHGNSKRNVWLTSSRNNCARTSRKKTWKAWVLTECNHSNQKLGITTAVSNAPEGIQHVIAKASRHKNVNTQKPYFKESSDVMQAYSRAISGKHVPSPTKSPKKSNKKPNKRSTPESHRKPSHINIPGESNTVSNVTFTNSDDSFIAPNEVAASTDTLPLQVLVPYDATEPIDN